MGVRVYDADTESCATSSSCCGCCNCASATTSKSQQTQSAAHTVQLGSDKQNPATTTQRHYAATTTTYFDASSPNGGALRTSKDFVGNAKEFRIEHNKNDLRIIGNNNRVRIGQNSGSIHIIGNNTRLKITQNDGLLQYTGNDGRICLGNDSQQQAVNYNGCNGTLKLVNTAKMQAKFSEKCKSKMDASQQQTPQALPAKLKVKSNSYGGERSKPEWQQLHELLQSKCQPQRGQQKTSMPNLAAHAHGSQQPHKDYLTSHCQITNTFNLVNSMGNVLITNAVNVSV